jgi:hypothetical protein
LCYPSHRSIQLIYEWLIFHSWRIDIFCIMNNKGYSLLSIWSNIWFFCIVLIFMIWFLNLFSLLIYGEMRERWWWTKLFRWRRAVACVAAVWVSVEASRERERCVNLILLALCNVLLGPIINNCMKKKCLFLFLLLIKIY